MWFEWRTNDVQKRCRVGVYLLVVPKGNEIKAFVSIHRDCNQLTCTLHVFGYLYLHAMTIPIFTQSDLANYRSKALYTTPTLIQQSHNLLN